MNLSPGWFDTEPDTEDVMNWSLYRADRATHIRIVAVALIAGTVIAGLSVAARDLNLGTDILTAQNPGVYRPAPAVMFTDRDVTAIR